MRRGPLLRAAAGLLAGIGTAALALAQSEDATARGRALYDENCASCHGANLEGQPDWRSPGEDGRYPAPPHDASGHTWHHSDADLIAYITLGGEQALAQMGVRFNSAMPAFGAVLAPKDVDDILAYIKSRWPERERGVQAERSLAKDQ
ncbi:cytochrome c [Pseudorhodobacter sp.]|uniref:c-type cytochrome n=1 Tax=Pseudorhodobacter sp. TaxID=1934400 RepID=UPI002AFF478C|nr:cytochrome c [Pseudorhodobacter sp.]